MVGTTGETTTLQHIRIKRRSPRVRVCDEVREQGEDVFHELDTFAVGFRRDLLLGDDHPIALDLRAALDALRRAVDALADPAIREGAIAERARIDEDELEYECKRPCEACTLAQRISEPLDFIVPPSDD